MIFPDIDSMQIYLDHQSHRNREVALSFIFIQLTTGLSTCRLIRGNRVMTKDIKAWHLTHASNAFHAAEAAMWKIKANQPEFDQMTAMAERLKFELDALRQEQELPPRRYNNPPPNETLQQTRY